MLLVFHSGHRKRGWKIRNLESGADTDWLSRGLWHNGYWKVLSASYLCTGVGEGLKVCHISLTWFHFLYTLSASGWFRDFPVGAEKKDKPRSHREIYTWIVNQGRQVRFIWVMTFGIETDFTTHFSHAISTLITSWH